MHTRIRLLEGSLLETANRTQVHLLTTCLLNYIAT